MTTASALRAQLIPMHNLSLLLPNTAVAEIIDYTAPAPAEGAPAWLLGHVAWRDRTLPLVCFETLCGRAAPEAGRSCRIAVLNTLNGQPDLPFVGVVTRGVPHLLRVAEGDLEEETGIELNPLIHCQLQIRGDQAIIPNLDALEDRVRGAVPLVD